MAASNKRTAGAWSLWKMIPTRAGATWLENVIEGAAPTAQPLQSTKARAMTGSRKRAPGFHAA